MIWRDKSWLHPLPPLAEITNGMEGPKYYTKIVFKLCIYSLESMHSHSTGDQKKTTEEFLQNKKNLLSLNLYVFQ